jgi:hypothetical protein
MKLCQLYVFNAFGVIVGFAFMKIIIVNTLHDTCIIMLIIMEIYLIKQIMRPNCLFFRMAYLLTTKTLPESMAWIYIRNLKKQCGLFFIVSFDDNEWQLNAKFI